MKQHSLSKISFRNPSLPAMCVILVLFLSSCASTASNITVLDWNDSLATTPISLLLTSQPYSNVDITRIEFHPTDKGVFAYIRFIDATGKIFKLPPHITGQWSLMGVDDGSSFSLSGYNETAQTGNIKTRAGYTEGQKLFVYFKQVDPDISYGIQLVVPISPDVVFERFIPIVIRDPRPNPFRF